MLLHIALALNDSEEIENFYENILLFSLKHKYTLKSETARQVFNLDEAVDVYMMGNNDIQLEIFLSPRKEKKVFAHICLACRKAEMMCKKASETGYKTLIKKNPVSDTYFIWDKSGNMFEIKEIFE